MSRNGSLDPRFAPVPMPHAPNRTRDVLAYDPRLAAHFDDEDVDLRGAWEILLRYRATIGAVVAVVVACALAASLLMRPVYRATALVEMRPQAKSPVSFDDRLPAVPANAREFMETQVRIIQSESVIDAVIDRLELTEDPELRGDRRQRGLLEGVRGLLHLTHEDPAEPELAADRLRFEIRRRFRERFSAAPLRESNLVRVGFDSFHPELAARAVNAAVEEYVRLASSRWHDAASGAKDFLEDEIARVEENLQRSERELNAFARSHDIVDVDERSDLLTARVSQLSAELTKGIQSRILAETTYRQVQSGRVDELAPVLGSELVRRLKEEQARLTAEYERLARIYRPGYPRLQQLAAQIDEVRVNQSREVHRLLESIQADYEKARHREALLQEQLEQEKQALLDLKDRAVQYHILKREWATNRDLHAGLLEQMKRVGVVAGIGPSQAALIDRANVPVRPHRPKPLVYTAGGAALGLALGILLAFLLAHLDDRVRTPDELEATTGLTNLGLVPKQGNALQQGECVEWLSHSRRNSPIAQALRALRTNLAAGLPAGGPRVIQVTSAWEGEGKTTTAVNLAIVMAQRGSRVLLIDGDMRRPRVHRLFDAPLGPGLAEVVTGEGVAKPSQTFVPNLAILPAGRADRDPADLLSSLNLAVFFEDACSAFEYIVVDSPPVLGLADSTLLSARVDGVVLVVAAARGRRGAVREAVRRLRLVGSPLIGAVLNRADARSDPYGYYGAYGNYGYGCASATHQVAGG